MFKKAKEVLLSVIPIVIIVLLIHITMYKFDIEVLVHFLLAVLLLIVGEVLFLFGVDKSIMPMGDIVGNSINKISKFLIILLFGFMFGFCATLAEPDVQSFVTQASDVGFNVSKILFMFCIGGGVGIGVAIGLFRIVANFSIKYVYLGLIFLVFGVAIFVPDSLIALAFDAGGATTGIVTAPFLLALGAGVVRNKVTKSTGDESFGMIGIASLLPVLAMLMLSFNISISDTPTNVEQYPLLINALINAVVAIVPIVLIFYIFQLLFVKLPFKKKLNLFGGILICFVGLFIFLIAISYGLIGMGNAFGDFLAKNDKIWLTFIICFVFGFVIACAEPGLKILGEQVESVTRGGIKKMLVVLSVALSMGIAVCLALIRTLYGVDIWWFLGIGYAIIIITMIFCPNLFTAIAFDSGGVASGPMSSSFLLPIMVGIASSHGLATGGFGLVALIAMMPIIVIQVLGLFYKVQVDRVSKLNIHSAFMRTISAEKFSNIDAMEYNHRKILRKKREQDYEIESK
ncbi:MAG: DUF1538 family protein [Clostridia bacterium]